VQLLYAVIMDEILTKKALALPGVYMTEGTQADFKMFAILQPGENRFTVKAPKAEIRAMLIDVGVAQAHSHLPRGNWMVLLLDKLDEEDVLERLKASYNAVFPNLPKRVKVSLGGVENKL